MVAPPFTLSNAASPITTPTYDGSGQTVHPDIIVFKNGFQGALSQKYTHIMAITPYPNGNDDYENPSIIVSNTPQSSFSADNITNPIDPEPAPNHNSDPDIVYKDGIFYLFYRETNTGTYYLRRRTSPDLVNWGSEQTLSGIPHDVLSPAIIYDEHENKWKMWAVVFDSGVEYYESDDGLNWTLVGLTNIPATISYLGSTRYAWHIDVNKTWLGKKYYALITYSSGSGGAFPDYLFFGESDDGINWTVYDQPILSPTGSGSDWDGRAIYRSTFIIEEGKIKVWYSAEQSFASPWVWRTGYTEADIDFVYPNDVTLNVYDVRPEAPAPPPSEEIVTPVNLMTSFLAGAISLAIIYDVVKETYKRLKAR